MAKLQRGLFSRFIMDNLFLIVLYYQIFQTTNATCIKKKYLIIFSLKIRKIY